MNIEYIKLNNFRCFSDITVCFDKKLTVLVGKNGTGKTALLDAVAVFLKAFMEKRASLVNFSAFEIKTNDISIRENGNFAYLVKIRDGEEIKLVFKKTQDREDLLRAYDEAIFNSLEKHMSCAPIFAYYGAQRCLPQNYKEKGFIEGARAAYANSFSSQIDFHSSLKWFDAKDAEEARRRSNNKDLGYIDPVLAAVRNAITIALGEDTYEFPHMDGVPPELFINNKINNLSYKIDQLSDGYKTMLALVMDLARRMAMVGSAKGNDTGSNTLNNKSIVLIDEVELHLHPSWQQKVLPSLVNIFPMTQFIVSTHSPQVITSIKPENIRIMTGDKAIIPDTMTYGTESEHVLEEIFGVNPRPSNEVKEKLDEYLDLVNNGRGNTPEARAIRAKLETWIMGDPILTQADMFILREDRRKARRGESDA